MQSTQSLFDLQAEVCKTLAHPKRLEIIHLLEEGEMTVNQLAQRMGIRKANLSQHLGMMRQRGVLVARRDGVNIYYRATSPKVCQACEIMREVLCEQLEEGHHLVKEFRASAR